MFNLCGTFSSEWIKRKKNQQTFKALLLTAAPRGKPGNTAVCVGMSVSA